MALREHRRTRFRILVVMVMACAVLAPGIPTAATEPSPSSSPTLTVHIEDLPAGLKGAVEVTGPDGYDVEVHRSRPLDGLTPGDYTVSASPVTGPADTYWPAPTDGTQPWQESVTVSEQQPQSVTVPYLDEISNEVHVVPLGSTQGLVNEGRDDQLSIVTSIAGETYRVGEYLASEPSPVAPDGYLVKVVKVDTGVDPTLERFEVSPVLDDIQDAIPEADVDEFASLTTDNQIFESDGVACGNRNTIYVSAEVRVTPTFTLKMQWRRFRPQHAELDASIDESASAQVVGRTGLDCHLESADLGPTVPLAPHGVVVFFIGPVPVVVKATLGVVAKGSVSLKAAFNAYAEQNASLRVHLYAPERGGHYGSGFDRDFNSPDGKFTREVDGTADVALVPEVRLRLYGLAGPTAGVKLSVHVHVTPDERTVEFCAHLEGRLHLPRLKAPQWDHKIGCWPVAKWLSS